MKHSLLPILVCLGYVASAQQCIGFFQSATQTTCITEVVDITPAVRLTGLSTEVAARSDVRLFSDYFAPPSLEAYKNLFHAGDWYGLDQKGFESWQANMRKYPLFIEGIVRFWTDELEWSAMQYYSIQNQQYARALFLAKKINGVWYPASADEEEKLREIYGLIRVLRPAFIRSAFKKEAKEEHAAVSSEAVKGNTILGDKVFSIVRASDPSSDVYKSAFYDLRQRVHPEADYARDRLHDAELQAYMDSLGISQPDQETVLDKIKAFDYLKAGLQIAQYTTDPVNFPPHVDAIRRIYGDDRIRKAQSN